MEPAAKVKEVRTLTGTAREILDHARSLINEAGRPDLPEQEKQRLRTEADQWLDKAKIIADSANRLAG